MCAKGTFYVCFLTLSPLLLNPLQTPVPLLLLMMNIMRTTVLLPLPLSQQELLQDGGWLSQSLVGDPFYQHRHPRCEVIDAFYLYVESLCKPLDYSTSQFYCGEHPNPGTSPDEILQDHYWCGTSDDTVLYDNNEWAVYTTIPDNTTINLIEFLTDGTLWGLRNNIMAN